MESMFSGFVKDGLIVPNAPLPEGAQVEIRICRAPLEMPPGLEEELAAWQRSSANALELVERLAEEGESHEKR